MRILLILTFFITTILCWGAQPAPKAEAKQLAISKASQECTTCHQVTTAGIVGQWKRSTHSKHGVGCMECHRAEKTDRDAYEHNGYVIATVVSPKDCAACHEKEFKEFQASHHSEAAKILD